MFSDIQKETLENLGRRLRDARLSRNDPQKEFAFRIGVSIPTLHKMEQGSPTVSVGAWVKALWVLNRLEDLDGLLAPRQSLFDQLDAMEKNKPRQRARRRT